MSRQPDLSIVSAVYMAEGCVREFHRRLSEVLPELTSDYEIVLVEDCGADKSWEIIRELSAADPKLRGLRLSRNFGQSAAIAAGLSMASGRRIVVMDCDLQDRPEDIPLLVEQAERGFDPVLVRRDRRKDSWPRRAASHLFFAAMNSISGGYQKRGIGTFSLLSTKLARQYLRVADMHGHYLSTLSWLGFRPQVVQLEHSARHQGSSSYSLRRLISHALNGIASHTTRLLHISTVLGFLFSLLAVVMIGWLVYRRLFQFIGVDGWASLMAVLLLVGGAVLFSLGVIGLYLGRMFERSKGRPLFIVAQETGEPAER